VRVVNSHAAENRKSLHKVLVVLREQLSRRKGREKQQVIMETLPVEEIYLRRRRVYDAFTYQIIKLINQLNHADDLAQRVLNGHAEDGFVLE
jgi:hypothetical protein